jgi:hypothetical protein
MVCSTQKGGPKSDQTVVKVVTLKWTVLFLNVKKENIRGKKRGYKNRRKMNMKNAKIIFECYYPVYEGCTESHEQQFFVK